ncbi:MAG: M23 family metallopeptidase [Firmicutes bacterium]|nr:M23 family metallopeptidase [Bacillota bacterium]
MKFKDLYSKQKYFVTAVIIIIAMLATFGAWKYKSYLDNKWAGIDFDNEIGDFEEEPKVQEGGISIIEENVEEEVNELEPDIKEVTQNEPPEPKLTKDTTVIPAIKMEEPKMDTMLTPVFGTICLDFSGEELVYSKTLDLWTTHQGLDIKSEEGSQVRAAMDGTVSEITNDPQWGLTIAIDHGSGITTRYSNLSTLDMVIIGQKVKKGDVISGVGRTALWEIAEDAHLHFEVLKDGAYLDPKIYLPKKSLNR